MKTLIAEGMFQGVLDITTAEVGAYVLDAESSSAGEDRLDAAVLAGLPQVVSVGGMDVIGIPCRPAPHQIPGVQALFPQR